MPPHEYRPPGPSLRAMPRPAAASSGDAPGVLAPLRAGEAAPEAAGGVAGADAGSTLGGVAKGFSFGDAKESRSTLSSVTSTVGRSVSQGDALAPPELRRTGGGRRRAAVRSARGTVVGACDLHPDRGTDRAAEHGCNVALRPARRAAVSGSRSLEEGGASSGASRQHAGSVPHKNKSPAGRQAGQDTSGPWPHGTRLRERPPVEAFARCQIHVADLPRRWNWSRSVESLVN